MNRTTPMLPEDDVRETPPDLFEQLDAEFEFNLDVCATRQNAKCSQFYSLEGYHDLVEFQPGIDGLRGTWRGARAWCNPPFSNIRPWVEKAHISEAELVVMLVPATRTEQPWWQDLIEPYRDSGQGLSVRFLRRRPRFLKDGVQMGSPKFGCCLLIWRA